MKAPLVLADPAAAQAQFDEAARLDTLGNAVLDGMERGVTSPQQIERWLRCRAKAASMRGQKFTPEQATAELVDRGLCKP